MQKQSIAQDPVQPKLVGVKGLRKIERCDVYCLASEKNGNFLANGIVVKNCDALRYAIYTHFFGKEGSVLTAADLEKIYAETRGAGPDLPAPFRDIPGLDSRF